MGAADSPFPNKLGGSVCFSLLTVNSKSFIQQFQYGVAIWETFNPRRNAST